MNEFLDHSHPQVQQKSMLKTFENVFYFLVKHLDSLKTSPSLATQQINAVSEHCG
jgi:hypothetical protein